MAEDTKEAFKKYIKDVKQNKFPNLKFEIKLDATSFPIMNQFFWQKQR